MEIFDKENWSWNWTYLCGIHGGLKPLNPTTNDLGVCFQQLCLQIPVLALIAITSGYFCGKRSSRVAYNRFSHYAITCRLIITGCLLVLPIIKAYIILSNTMTHPDHLHGNVTLLFSNETTAARPIDYMVAGTEGIAWMVHFCFILSLMRGPKLNLRGPVIIRVLIFMLIAVSGLLLQTHIKHEALDDALPNLSLGFSISVVTFLILYVLTLIPSEGPEIRNQPTRNIEVSEHTALLNTPNSSYVHFPEEQEASYLGTAMEGSSALSILLFYWVIPLMKKGIHGSLNHSDDLYDLPEHISTPSVVEKINKHIRKRPKSKRNLYYQPDHSQPERISSLNNNINLYKLLHKCFGWQFYSVGIFKFVADCSDFVGPILLNKLVGFIEDKDIPMSFGYLYAFLMFISASIGALASSHFSFWMAIVGMKIRAAIVTLVYRKILFSSTVKLNQEFSMGQIVNFMSIDSDRIVNSVPSFHTLWSIPLQLAVTLYLLYNQIGLSFLAGVGFSIILIPINKVIANKIGVLSTKMMKFKDQRVCLMGETLRGLTTIKLNVWEEHFLRRIFRLRENEIKYLKKRKYLDALCVYFWATTPVLISILTFATYVSFGNKLDAKTVFTSMALLNMLIAPLNAFPWVLNGLTEAWVSINRIQRLLDLTDLDISTYYSDPPMGIDVFLQNAVFTVNGNEERGSNQNDDNELVPVPSTSLKSVTFDDGYAFALKNINLEVKRGQLVGIIGTIGSGKSLLLNGFLAEITKIDGIVAINDLEKGFAYVKQSPWLQRGTIRENILFGKPYDYVKYKNVIKACALKDDLMKLPKKDLTGIGEAGNTLSGGQKTRISLARAVYADKNIYFLDDVLATLDTKVAKHIFDNVILGLLKNKTRIICTHQIQYLIHANLVVEMSKGKILKQGLPSEVLSDFEDYLLSSGSMDYTNTKFSINSAISNDQIEIDDDNVDALLDKEFMEKGTIHFGVYGAYLTGIGRPLTIIIFLSLMLMQSSKNITDLWLSFWVTHTNETVNSTRIGKLQSLQFYYPNTMEYYLTIYGILAAANSFFTLFRAFIFAYGGVHAAIVIHKQLLKVVMKAQTVFFDSQPLGRILNRFSTDTYTVDDTLPFISNILLAQFFGLVGSVIITAYGLPWILLILVPLIPIYHWLQYHYRLTSRELKRLSSTSLSPLYTHFNETLQGLSIIRAFRAVSRFNHEIELYLEASQKTNFASTAAAQWLSLRLQFIAVIILGGVCLMAVLQHHFDVADPGLIGLAITYALSLTGLLSGVLNAFTETEREMISVERIKQYLDKVPIENPLGDNPPYAWPSQGVVEFKQVYLKYRPDLGPSLNKISFKTRPSEKIGIVGRTGSGKTSIFNSLFRLIEIDSGEILIDNVNVKYLQLNALRSRISIIPQNPFLFSGSIRENVDPLDEYPDLQIYKALEKCKLDKFVIKLGGLDANLEENGNNLSAGQKQLFCLVRAILHNARILFIDEATANIDPLTDKAIQSTIKSSFRSATVMTIAHRIRTIMHCDRVIVMENGHIQEFDEPNVLMDNVHSYFFKLANQEFTENN